MASKVSQYVTIPLEEYKELLLKENPTDTDKLILGRIMDVLPSYLKYNEECSSWETHLDKLQVTGHSEKFIYEILRIFKYSNFETYMDLWNRLATENRNQKALQAKISQMREAKELRDDKPFRDEDE